MGEFSTEHKEIKPEIPFYDIQDLESDLNYYKADLVKDSRTLIMKNFAEDAMKYLESEFYPRLGVIHYAVENGIYKSDKPHYQTQMLEWIDELEKNGERLATLINQQYNIEIPTFDMTKIITEYI